LTQFFLTVYSPSASPPSLSSSSSTTTNGLDFFLFTDVVPEDDEDEDAAVVEDDVRTKPGGGEKKETEDEGREGGRGKEAGLMMVPLTRSCMGGCSREDRASVSLSASFPVSSIIGRYVVKTAAAEDRFLGGWTVPGEGSGLRIFLCRERSEFKVKDERWITYVFNLGSA